MNKLSRRDFLKAAAGLTATGALAWVADASPVIGVDKAVEGGDRTVYDIYNDKGELILDDDDILTEWPFTPYYLDPYSDMWKVPLPRGMLDGNET